MDLILLERCAAGSPATSYSDGGYDVVARVDVLLHLDAEVRDIIAEFDQRLADTVAPAMHRGVEIVLSVPPCDVVVEKLGEARGIGTVDRRVGPPHDLHVLLRHRLLLQPQGCEGAPTVTE